MGLEDAIKNMKPKRLKLFETLILIGIICTLLYFGLVFVFVLHFNFMVVFINPVFAQTIVLLVVFGIVWKILHGGKITVPTSQTEKPTTQCWSCKHQYQYTKNPFGDTKVKCPKCGNEGMIKRGL